MKKMIPLFSFLYFTIVFLEIIFHLAVFQSFDFSCLYIIFISLPICIIVTSLFSLLESKINYILTYLFTIINVLMFIIQLIYYKVYESVLSIKSLFKGGQVLEFKEKIIEVIIANIGFIILLLIPLFVLIIINHFKKIPYNKIKIRLLLLHTILALMVQLIIIIFINFYKQNDLYSAKELYYNSNSAVLIAKKFGVMTEVKIDIKHTVFGFNEQIKNDEPIKKSDTKKENNNKKIEYNTMNIDFNNLASNEKDSTLKSMYEYFASQSPSEKNEYTGMFKGKNLIVFVAEAFNNIAIDKNLTPNLYKLYNEGFQFDNFYTPVFPVSTADGEYITDTSLIPKEGVWSLKEINGNYIPFSYPNVFEHLGYSSNAYHDHNATYYNRDTYIATMGYNSYIACKRGLNINCKQWPESDLEMISATTNDYIKNSNFLAYYMTVSGHLNYTKLGNMMVSKNWSYVSNLPYSDKVKGYLAGQIELDKAIGELLLRLKNEGKLENTVIMLSPDHYPYGLTLDEINEIANPDRDDVFEKHRTGFLLWSGSMKKSIKVLKYGSSLDIVPTILNLFGVEYDSRLLMGSDILSNSTPLVIYSNRSFITNLGKYNSLDKTFSSFNNKTVSDDYIKNISHTINNKYLMSRLILEKDFYRILYKKLGKI